MSTITIYTSASCGACTATKHALRRAGLDDVREVRVDLDPTTADLLRSTGYQQLPVVTVENGPTWSGYKPEMIAQIASL